MKEKIDKKYLSLGITIFAVIAASIILFFIFYRFDKIALFFVKIFNILSPILLGLLIAYILNPALNFFEKKVYGRLSKKIFKKLKHQKRFTKIMAMVTVSIIFFGIIFGTIYYLIPEILNSLNGIINNIPDYFGDGKDIIKNMFSSNTSLQETVLGNYEKIQTTFIDWINNSVMPDIGNIAITISSNLFNILKWIIDILLGFVVSIYVLIGKNRFIAQAKKLLYAFVNPKRCEIILSNIRYTNKIFSDFLFAKVIDSLIIGILCFLFMIIFKMPYAVLIAVIVGITNIIPYFGPFIGAIPSAVLILLVSPAKCLTFLIFILILQQFDGNILGPKIMGGKTGLKSFWVLASILVFGGLFGFIGMLFGVPIFAILYSFINGLCMRKLESKKLPTSTKEYEKIDHIDPSTNKPIYM